MTEHPPERLGSIYGRMIGRTLRRGQGVIVVWASASALILALLRLIVGARPPLGGMTGFGGAAPGLDAAWSGTIGALSQAPHPRVLVAAAAAIMALSFLRMGLSGPLIQAVLGRRRVGPWAALKRGLRASPRAALAEVFVATCILGVSSLALLMGVELTMFVELTAASVLAMVPFLASRVSLRRAFWVGTSLGKQAWLPIFALLMALVLASGLLELTRGLPSWTLWSALFGYELAAWVLTQSLFLALVERARSRGQTPDLEADLELDMEP